MKTIRIFGLWVLVAALPASLSLRAEQPPAGKNDEHTWTGTLTAVNSQRNTVTGKRGWLAKTFNLGPHGESQGNAW